MTPTAPIVADLLISGATLVTVDAGRRVIRDGALAIAGREIVAVGPAAEIEPRVRAARTLDGRRFVATPGFIDGHIHITGDPLTRGFARGGPEVGADDRLMNWVIPIFRAQTPADEALAAQLAALAMIRYGTTCFMEAGTVSHLDAVMEALAATGIRGRVGEWVEGRIWHGDEADRIRATDAAIAALESEVARYPDDGQARLAAWPILVGHSTNPDAVWRAAKGLADRHGLTLAAHMSPGPGDADWYLANTGRRPLEHLEAIGALGSNVALTHLVHIDEAELAVLRRTGAHAIHCPKAGLLGGYGLSRVGRFPEMIAGGVNVMLGTDGAATDILSSARLMAGIFRDARQDEGSFQPGLMLEAATINGARGMGLDHSIGSLEVGKRADFVLHDTGLPQWGPLFDPAAQLALHAPPHGVHSVWVDGVQLLDAGRSTMIDEEKLLADARQAGMALIARTGLPAYAEWPAG